MITKQDYAEATWLKDRLLLSDKQVILDIQEMADKLGEAQDELDRKTYTLLLTHYIGVLAERLKVSRNVVNALACFEVEA